LTPHSELKTSPGSWEYETHCFSGRYTIERFKRHRRVEWDNGTVTLWHTIPVGDRGIPYTRPNATALDFLPPAPELCKHTVCVRPHPLDPLGEDLYANPRYSFESIEDRDKFQQAIRGCAEMRSFTALAIKPIKGSKSLSWSMDAEVKIWLEEDVYAPAKLTFARNIDRNDDKKKNEQYSLAWFQPPFEKVGTYRLIVARESIAATTGDGGKSRAWSFAGPSKRHSTSSDSRGPPKRRESAPLSIEAAGGVVPESLRKLGGFKIQFAEGEGSKFAAAWACALRGLSLTGDCSS